MENFESVAGYGLKARIAGKIVLAGKEKLLRDILNRLAGEGKTLSLLAVDGIFAGVIAAADPPRINSKKTIAVLKRQIALVTINAQFTPDTFCHYNMLAIPIAAGVFYKGAGKR